MTASKRPPRFMLTFNRGDRMSLDGAHFRVLQAKAYGNGVVLCLREIKPKRPAGVFKRAFPKATQRHL